MISAALVLLTLSSAAEPQRAVLLPVKIRSTSEDAEHAGPAIDGALAAALGRHASFHVLNRTEIVALVGKAAERQLMGCDAESCIAEVADALGAELLVSTQLDDSGGLWNLQATLLDRRSATALQRAGIRARTLDALLASVDDVARKLVGAGAITANDPTLAFRLGTDAQGAALLQEELARSPESSLVDAWTEVVVQHNRKSNAVAVLASVALGLASASTVLAFTAFFLAQGVHGATLQVAHSTLSNQSTRLEYSWATLAAQWLLPAPFALVSVAALVAAAGLVIWNVLQPKRILVRKNGCCRNEDQIQEASRPSMVQIAASVTAGLGAAAVLVSPMLLYPLTVVTYAAGQIVLGALGNPPGSTVNVSLWEADRLDTVGGIMSAVCIVGIVGPAAAGAAALSVVMLVTARSRVLDDVAIPPPQTPTTNVKPTAPG